MFRYEIYISVKKYKLERLQNFSMLKGDVMFEAFYAIQEFTKSLKESIYRSLYEYRDPLRNPRSNEEEKLFSYRKGFIFYAKLVVEDTKIENYQQIMNIIHGFNGFFHHEKERLLDKEKFRSIAKQKTIAYGKKNKIYIPIGDAVLSASDEEKEIIRAHLLKIYCILAEKPKEYIDEIEKMNGTSANIVKEGDEVEGTDLMSKIMKKAEILMESDDNETNDPTKIANKVISSGFMEDIVGSMQNKDGELDFGNMFKGLFEGMKKMQQSDPEAAQMFGVIQSNFASAMVDNNNKSSP